MPKIVKKTSGWRKRYNLYLAIIWTVIGIYNLFISDIKASGILYLFLGISYFAFHMYNQKKGRNRDYIKWDDQLLEVGSVGMKPLKYSLEEIQNITVTPNNFIIKSGAAAGTMVELKGFSSEDLDLLKSRFASEAAA